MPNFKEIQAGLAQAKKDTAAKGREFFLAKEKLGKLKRDKLNINRGQASVYGDIEESEQLFVSSLADNSKLLGELSEIEHGWLDRFKEYTDPRQHIDNLPDDVPTLLFPVRLETRFKKINVRGGGIQHQLWVRVFPDACSIDTFEDIPSEAEIRKTKDYWTMVWSAGQSADPSLQTYITNQQKGAWKLLAGSLQAGRAYWLTQTYVPSNPADMPVRNAESDILMVIPATQIPAESAAIGAYWASYAKAQDANEQQAAFRAFSDLVGDAEIANLLLSEYKPAQLPSSAAVAEASVQVAFLQFPQRDEVDTKLSAWTQPAKVNCFPERFVLMGYSGEVNGQPRQVVNEIGGIIPDPLVVGPNPSLDTRKVLRDAWVEDFINATAAAQQAKLTEAYDNSIDDLRLSQTREAYIATFSGLNEAELLGRLELAFDNLKDEVKAASYIEYLCQRSETKWLFDFEEAIQSGMGFKVDLSREVYENGFDRLFVLGVKLGADSEEGKDCMETLLKNHHYGASGFSIVRQGTPTNNTETEDAGYSTEEDADATFDQYLGTSSATEPSNGRYMHDGKWLSKMLGIDAEAAGLTKAENYFHTDLGEARAMNTALWNATIGYFMDNMMAPVFTDSQKALVRQFFTDFVVGRGGVPSIRIGNQPYGILPIGRMQDNNWLFQERDSLLATTELANSNTDLRKMYRVLRGIREDFESLLQQVAYVGQEGDAHAILLKALGLQASSVEFDQRYAESFNHLYNYLIVRGSFNRSKVLGGISKSIKGIFSRQSAIAERWDANNAAELKAKYKEAGLALLGRFGYAPKGEEEVPILTKFFLTKENRLKNDLIDDQPFSEQRKIRPYALPTDGAATGDDYITWLMKNAKDDFDKIKNQEGFIDNQVPNTLLYKMLRHALTLGFADSGFQVYQNRGVLSFAQVAQAKRDTDFIGIQAEAAPHVSKWDYLDNTERSISDVHISKYISLLINDPEDNETVGLKEMLEALEHLKDVPTARLERVFAEHLDCCSYRLDAWLLGFAQLQLHLMRATDRRMGNIAALARGRDGLYLGAYGWVENLKAKDAQSRDAALQPATLTEELAAIFNPKNEDELFTDSDNGGYIHAPSVNQAITAAVLRNAHITRADKNDDDTYKVNLSSERVRMALSIIEGMQQGQKMGALLGYQLERGLHDRTDQELDVFIYELRKVFPLMSNKNKQTDVGNENDELNDEGAITKMEARNVVDGLALVEHINKTGNAAYPFGFAIGSGPQKLREASVNEIKAINQEVNRLLNINDAIADLALSESVHQLVQSNYDRAAGTLETYSKGGFPQTPEIIRTPRSGTSLTHRFGIHLNPDAVAPLGSNGRATIAPSVNDFVSHILPDMADIQVRYSMDDPAVRTSLGMDALLLDPIDLLYMVNPDTDKNLSGLDDYMLKWIHENRTPRPNADIRIHYTDTAVDAGKVALFQILPLVKELKTLLLAARPLKSTDIQLPNEAKKEELGEGAIDKSSVQVAFDTFKTIVNTSFVPNLFEEATDINGFGKYFVEDRFDKENQTNDVAFLHQLDAFVDHYTSTLYQLNQFGMVQAGFGYVYERKREIYGKIYQKVADHKARWEEKLVQFDVLIKESNDPLANEEQQLDLLRKAERTISTSYTTTFDAIDPIGTYRNDLLANNRVAFDSKRQAMGTWLGSTFLTYESLQLSIHELQFGASPLADFDLLPLETAEDEWQMAVLAEDLVSHVLKLKPFIDGKIKEVQSLLDEHDTAPSAGKKVKLLTAAAQALFGDDFKLVPKFELSASQQTEIQQSFDNQAQLLKYQTDVKGADFPKDDWLYSVSRVREKLGAWENLVVLSEQIKDTELELTPLQFPYKAQDTWLALEYPSDYEIESDKLLYTAYFQAFGSNNKQCGLLIDEFTEVIPARTETTGITFQYDQPNAEPPQAMLLALPTTMTGAWSWDDLVGTLHEALDLSRLRAIEPEHIEQTTYGQFLPATVSAVTTHPFATMGVNFLLANNSAILKNNP